MSENLLFKNNSRKELNAKVNKKNKQILVVLPTES